MDEENPLQTHISASSSVYGTSNKSGRPTNTKIIKFSAQPQSIMSQLLRKIKEEDFTVSIKIEDQELQENEPTEAINDDIQLEDNDIICHNCSYRSSNKKEHQLHLNTHRTKLFSCDYPNCSYACKLSSNLIKHKRIHTAEKPYLCDQCSFRTNFVNSLKVHRRIHTDERPYGCAHCSYRCNSSSNLKKHCQHRHSNIISKQ